MVPRPEPAGGVVRSPRGAGEGRERGDSEERNVSAKRLIYVLCGGSLPQEREVYNVCKGKIKGCERGVCVMSK